MGEGSLKQKCRDNFTAIELVRKLDAEERAATDEERRVLVKYVGWGGIPQVFAWHESSGWDAERERLKNLLTEPEYEAARASTLNAHYTSPIVVSAMFEAVQRLGFAGRVRGREGGALVSLSVSRSAAGRLCGEGQRALHEGGIFRRRRKKLPRRGDKKNLPAGGAGAARSDRERRSSHRWRGGVADVSIRFQAPVSAGGHGADERRLPARCGQTARSLCRRVPWARPSC